jgi:hypothetical protein
VSASVAVWVREPEVPVKVMVGEADAAVIGAVSVMVAEGCAGVSASVDGFAVTPEGSPEIVTDTEPLKELSAVAVTVMALLVVPAAKDNEPGETAREKSGAGLGGQLPQVVSSKTNVRAVMSPSALARIRMSGRRLSSIDCTAPMTRQVSSVCHSLLPSSPEPCSLEVDMMVIDTASQPNAN